MARYATVTYNRHANFTNYGSALQTWALHRAIERVAPFTEVICLDYCPDSHREVAPLDPFHCMWDADEESKGMVELSMPAIRSNLRKFERFYDEECRFTKRSYTSADVGESLAVEGLDGYVCGSDTIFCIREFGGFDLGYFADVPQMRGRSVAYAASFGDVDWTDEELRHLADRLKNFKAIGLRESGMIEFARRHASACVERVADPTLLLRRNDYLGIAADIQYQGRYLLLYSRRYDPAMESYAEKVAHDLGCQIVEISLRASNADRGHHMRYDAGVEEYLALVRDATYMVTNSYHGLVFAVQMGVPFTVFTREQAGCKIVELLRWLGLEDRRATVADGHIPLHMGFGRSYDKLEGIREQSLSFLRKEIDLLGVAQA